MLIERLPGNPLVTPASHASLGQNINGPSLIRAPKWLRNPLGRYYLYFAHHHGQHIRLAYADALEGPWTIYPDGVLPLEQSTCINHVASPDAHVDEEKQEIRLYFHGVAFPSKNATDGHERLFGNASRWIGDQRSKVAISQDGLHFEARPENLGASYFRVFRHQDWFYALAMPGVFYRSRDGLSDFEMGPICFDEHFRHCAVWVDGHLLHVFYSKVGDEPERILHATVDIRGDWRRWRASEPETVLQPEERYEGALLPLAASLRGASYVPVRQLRDPAVFHEDGQLHLLYSIAGEQGIAISRLDALSSQGGMRCVMTGATA